jgi:DNA-binding MarR family transcriptional regulator
MNLREKQKTPDYQTVAEFRYRIRRYLRFSEQAARAAGLEPQQYQLLLALKGLPAEKKSTIGTLAERLQLEHHSTVELIDRLEQRRLVRRSRDTIDRRQVLIQITPKGDGVLHDLVLHHLEELETVGPELVHVLNRILSRLGLTVRRLKAVNEK